MRINAWATSTSTKIKPIHNKNCVNPARSR
jgi:hypothetical protein